MAAVDEAGRVAAQLVQVAISRSAKELAEEETSSVNAAWPNSEEFTVEAGQRVIEKAVQVAKSLLCASNISIQCILKCSVLVYRVVYRNGS